MISGYMSGERAESLRRDVDRIFEARTVDVQVRRDERLFGIENLSEEVRGFNQDPTFARIGRLFLGELSSVSTMANRLVAGPGRRSSGGGWHRDRLRRQFKAMLYLSDVAIENGPLSLLRGSKTPSNVWRDSLRIGLARKGRRYQDAQIERILRREGARQEFIVAPAGTVILFDSSTIHRGMPIRSGSRHALTNYYYEPRGDRERRELLEKFKPVGGLSDLPLAKE